ncbi:MAG: phospholipid carrier-dependent glycosyltransferase [Lentisphaerae bacterium]|jgi:4-amino-4-deoxy-L-arabinose transferase-like glycosyltransferase|nr:phospholipid carrier-dependent glycosyltransferase [Lentisphaerota bacterium]
MQKRVALILLALILVAAGLRGWRLAPRGIAAGDEALTALRALGLMEHGRWWTPYWNGAPDLHKPPLYYAMVAVGYCIFGVGTLAIRLPSMAAYLLIIVLAYALGRRIFDPVVGLGAALLTALHPTLAAQACVGMMDTTMIAFSLAAVYLLLLAAEHPLALPGWGVCCGLAMLAKGEAAAPILAASLLYVVLFRRDLLRRSGFHGGLLLALMLPGIWFGSQFIMHRDLFLKPHYTDIKDYRFRHSWRDAALFLKSIRCLWASWGGLAPLVFAAPLLVAGAAWRQRRKALVATVSHESILLALAGLVPLVLVSLVRQQMPWYMLPAVVPLAVFTAAAVRHILRPASPPVLRVTACLLLAAGSFLPGVYSGPRTLPGLVCAAAIAGIVLTLPRSPRLHSAAAGFTLLGLVLALAGCLSTANPRVNQFAFRSSETMRDLAQHLPPAATAPGAFVANFRHFHLNSLMFYCRRDSVQLRPFSQAPMPPGRAVAGVLKGGGCREFLQAVDVQSLTNHAGYEVILIRNTAQEAVVPAVGSRQ